MQNFWLAGGGWQVAAGRGRVNSGVSMNSRDSIDSAHTFPASADRMDDSTGERSQ